MKRLLFVILLFYNTGQAQLLADDIYHNLDVFVADASLSSLEVLSTKAKKYDFKEASKEDYMALVVTYYNMGYYYATYGKLLKSISSYETSWKYYTDQNISGYDIVTHCLIPLSVLYTKQSDFENAKNILNQCIGIADKNGDQQQKISSIISLSIVHHNTAKYNTALSLLTNTLAHHDLNKLQRSIIRNNIASNLIALKRYTAATSYLKQNLKSNSKTRITTYKSLAYIAMQEKQFPKAHSYFDLAKKELTSQIDIKARDLAKLYAEEAELFLMHDQIASSKKSLKKALRFLLPNYNSNKLPSKELLYPENTFITIFDLYGTISSSLEEALNSYDLSFYTTTLLNQKWASQETKIIHQNAIKDRTEKCIKLLYDTYRKSKKIAHIERAFQYMENSKAAVLKENRDKKTLLAIHPSDSLLLKEQQLRQQQESVTDLLIRAQLKKAPDNIINNPLTNRLNTITLAANSLKTKINTSYPLENKTISITKLQEKLKNDSAILISYFLGKAQGYQFICTKNSLQINLIPLNTDFSKTLRNYNNLFENASVINNNIPYFTTTAFKTYQLLNFQAVQNHKNVIVIPDGILNFVSFESLLTEKTNGSQFAKMPFVVKKHQIAYNTTAHFYLREQQISSSNTLLGFFPIFKNTDHELSYSINEANNIKKEVATTLFMNEDATKANFIKNASKYAILHLSTHADSGNFVVPANIQFHDDILFLKELYSLDLSPDLVVLSACETGVGKSRKGEGVMSIARGFQYAGAASILFTLWKINDRSTSEIMTSFYNDYSSSSSAFISNHNAKIAYLENATIGNAKKSPYYWNAFVYYGTITPSSGTLHYWVFAVIVILIVVFLGLKQKKK